MLRVFFDFEKSNGQPYAVGICGGLYPVEGYTMSRGRLLSVIVNGMRVMIPMKTNRRGVK